MNPKTFTLSTPFSDSQIQSISRQPESNLNLIKWPRLLVLYFMWIIFLHYTVAVFTVC